MKKIDNKGFTIIEVLIVIAIIGILSGISIPLVSRYLKSGKEKYYNSLSNELKIIARNYYSENKKELPRGVSVAKILKLETLESSNLIVNEVVDTNNNSCEQSYILVDKNPDTKEYQYTVCLICNGKVIDETNCVDGLLEGESRTQSCGQFQYTSNGRSYVPGQWTNNDVTATLTADDISKVAYFYVGSTRVTVHNENPTVKLTNSGDFVVHMLDKYGNDVECENSISNIKVDKKDPECKWTGESTTWAGNRTISVACEDEDSGCKTSIQSKTYTITTTKETLTYNIKDNAGNEKECTKEVSAYVDKTGPSCAWTSGPSKIGIKSGEAATYVLTCTDNIANAWTDSTITNADFTVTGSLSVTNVSKAAVTNGYKYTITVTGGSTTATSSIKLNAGTIVDAFNNKNSTSSISNPIIVDNNPPSCTWTSGPSKASINIGETATYVLTCTDNLNNTWADSTIVNTDFNIIGSLSVTNISKVAVTNGFKYTITVTGGSTAAESTIQLKSGVISDSSSNLNALSTVSATITSKGAIPECTLTSTGNWDASQTLTITSTSPNLAAEPYSFTSDTSGFSSTATLSNVKEAKKYIAYIKNQYNNVGNCEYTVTSRTEYRSRTRGTTNNGKWTAYYCGSGYGSSAYGTTYYQDWSTKTYVPKTCAGYVYACGTSQYGEYTQCVSSNPSSSLCVADHECDCEAAYYKYTCYRYGSWGSWSSWGSVLVESNYNNADKIHTKQAESRIVYK